MIRSRFGGPSATLLTPVLPHGTNPTLPGPIGMPVPLWRTVTIGNIRLDRMFVPGRMSADPLLVDPQYAFFTVDNNDFTTGRAVLVVGEHELVSNIDYIPGVNAEATAISIAAAISRVPGFLSEVVPGLPIVAVAYDTGSISLVDFYALHHGTVVNFAAFNPDDGTMRMGRPSIAPPLLAP